MDAQQATRKWAEVIDGHRWSELADLLHPDFRCRMVPTGEEFERDSWVRLNADYPGFENFVLEDVVASGDRAVARALVTGTQDGRPEHFGVASFLTMRDGLIAEMTEVWTDIDQSVDPERRPA